MKEYLPEIREKVNELERLQRLNENQAKQILYTISFLDKSQTFAILGRVMSG
jgi:hypothetical protein